MSSDPQPDMPEGYLGAQERFNELGLSILSHTDPVVIARDNHFELKLKHRGPIKVTHQLQFCKDEKDYSEFVFTQLKDGNVQFLIHFPLPGWYKLQVYALPLSDPSKSLPNVYNYLLHCTKALNPAFPFPKQYVQWKDGCYLHEPLNLCESTKLTHVKWRVLVPHAKQVAVVVDEEWHHLENKGGPIFEGTCNLNQYRGKDKKVTLNANFGDDDSKYSTLLEYHIK